MTPSDTPAEETSDGLLYAALLRGSTYETAATEAGYSRSTVSRRMADPAFRSRLDALRAEVLARVADRLAAESLESVTTLARIRSDKHSSPSVQIRAANALINSALRYRAAVELDARVAALESTLKLGRTN